MGRRKLKPGERRGVHDRLAQYVRARYGSWKALEVVGGVPHASADTWRVRGALPDVRALVELAKRDRDLSLDWLLLGRGATSATRPGPGYVPVDEVQNLLRNLARGALWRVEKERKNLLPRQTNKPRARGRSRSLNPRRQRT